MEKILIDIGKRRILLGVFLLFCSCSHINKQNPDVSAAQDVLEQVFARKDIANYIHPDVPGRLPITIVTNGRLPKRISLTAFGQNVVFLQSKRDAASYFDVDQFQIQETRIKFVMYYDIEGLRVTGEAANEQGEWSLISMELSEY